MRLLDAETAILASGGDIPAHLYEFRSNGTVDHGSITDTGNRGDVEVCLVAPDLYYCFGRQHLNTIGVVKVANGTKTDMREDKYKECWVHRDDNTPLKEYPVRLIQHTRSPAAGKAFGIASFVAWEDSRPKKVVAFRNGIWYAVADLPENRINDAWFHFQGGELQSVVTVGPNGYVHAHRLQGAKIDQPITTGQEATSFDLINVWGVSPEKFWVMDKNGTVWERTGANWRIVVRGLYRDGVEFVAAWVSPKGTIIALTKKEVYRLE